MKKFFSEKCRKMTETAGCLLMAAVLAVGYLNYREVSISDLPELTSYTDPDTVVVSEEDVPLAPTSKTTKKVTQKVTTKKTKMKKKAAKTSTTTKKSTKITNKNKKTSGQQIKINTKVDTTIKTQTKKNSKIKTTQTKVVTTVVTTTTTLEKQYSKTDQATTSASASKNGTYAVRNVARFCDNRVLSAFEKMGCKVVVDSSVSYAGCFDASKRTITLKRMDSTVYHELGHFLEFCSGTSDVKKLIEQVYSKEKSRYNSYNKTYVLQNSGEYFAESFKNYCENPSALKKSRPLTYDAIVRALNNVTDSRVNMIMSAYASVWK